MLPKWLKGSSTVFVATFLLSNVISPSANECPYLASTDMSTSDIPSESITDDPKRRSQSNSIPVRITPRPRPPRQKPPHQLTINNQCCKSRAQRVHGPNYSNLVKIPTAKIHQPKSPYFKLVHLNIRSLRNTAHLIQLKEFL